MLKLSRILLLCYKALNLHLGSWLLKRSPKAQYKIEPQPNAVQTLTIFTILVLLLGVNDDAESISNTYIVIANT